MGIEGSQLTGSCFPYPGEIAETIDTATSMLFAPEGYILEGQKQVWCVPPH